MMLNKRRRWFHTSRVKLPFCEDVGELVRGINIFDLDFGLKGNSAEQPVKSNSVGFGQCLNVELRPLMIILTPLRYLPKCTTETHLEKNVREW